MAAIKAGRLAESPQVSVVIGTRNRADIVGRTISDLRRQVGASPFEILVVDDGSERAVVLDGLVDEPAVRVSRIRHQGRSAARNHGAELARGSTLIFLDDDIRPGQGFVAAHERAHRTWHDALAVGPQVLSDHRRETPFGRFRDRLERSSMPPAGGVVDRPNFCTAANMSIPRRLFAELGGFNPQHHCAEDQDLALRHSERGRPIVFVPEARAVHDDLALDIRSYSRKMEWTGRHLVDFCRAQPGWPENEERLRINGPPLPGREPSVRTAKKLVKTLLDHAAVLEVLFGFTTLVERTVGDGRLLDWLYRTLVGVHLQRGFRKGLRSGGREPRSARETP